MKVCSKCGETKQSTEFHRRADRPSGIQPHCKVCAKAKDAAWYKANSEKKRAYNAKRYTENPEKARAFSARYAAANPESVRIKYHNRRAREVSAGRLSPGITRRIFDLQKGKCACGCKQPLGNDFHRDHIMPLALGGTNTDDNIQLLRATCNLQKHAKHPVDFMQQRGFLL